MCGETEIVSSQSRDIPGVDSGRQAIPGPRRGLGSGTDPAVASAYRAADMASATPRRLRVLLYDAAVSLCRQAITALDEGDACLAADRLAKALRTVQQLQGGISGDDTPRCVAQFTDLYDEVRRRLAEADFYRRREPLTETVSLLDRRRIAWRKLAMTLSDNLPADHDQTMSKSWVG